MREAVRQWNEGNIPGVPDNVELQDAELTFLYLGKPRRPHSGCSSQLPLALVSLQAQ